MVTPGTGRTSLATLLGHRLEKNQLFGNISRQILCKLEQKRLQNKSEISNLFGMRCLFQLRVNFVVYVGKFRYMSKIYDIFSRFFVPT